MYGIDQYFPGYSSGHENVRAIVLLVFVNSEIEGKPAFWDVRVVLSTQITVKLPNSLETKH